MPSTRNVTKVYRSATPEQVAAGLKWYEAAYDFCVTTAMEYGVTPEVVAGVTAAMSPLNPWGSNKAMAERAVRTGEATGYLGDGCRKANAIMGGTDPLEILTSDKVRNFYLCILTSGQHKDAVCIDRHAYDVAEGKRHTDATRPKLSGKRYTETAETYRRAARILSRESGQYLSPAQVQAVTWLAWRRRFWSEGAYDGVIDITDAVAV